jgi:hypothetical protein
LAGAVVLGIAAGFRPQNLLIGAVPLLLAFLCQRRTALVGAGIVAAIVAVSYGSAAVLSGGVDRYLEQLRFHERYIRRTDSFLAAGRPSLLQVADDFFLRPYRAAVINVTIAVLALVALIRKKPHTLMAMAIFGPFCLFAWLFLDFHSASRFSIASMPLFAILAADGLDVLRRARAVGLAVVAGLMVAWTWPALRVVRTTGSPPAAAADWIRSHLRPESAILYVDSRMTAHADALLREYRRIDAEGDRPAIGRSRSAVVWLKEGATNAAGAQTFAWATERLGGIARRRYFAASVVPVHRIEFAEGWYGEEGNARSLFRWMAARSRAILPAGGRNARLTLRFDAPVEARIAVSIDGRVIDRFLVTPGSVEKTWDVAAGRELVIETDRVTRAPGDPRDLGLRLEWIEYRTKA